MNPNLGTIAAGGVVRDHKKNWMVGFALNKGTGSVLEAELWGILEGLKLLWKKGFKKHVYRGSNRVADSLANLGHSLDLGITVFEEPPPLVVDRLEDDFKGVTFSRMIPSL
ncbi:hypothetical protein Ddye_014145 [Dipteronia dyeriana]|uniref:RNase H type-1 domain-containing protein n=1 Tax=Dipteronia dyeriana TaxID=168575 RepID=A0AAD9X7L1_9ROSI|nr:hypothetical protein Ddye_014145 [Dipteronia dyeriana]